MKISTFSFLALFLLTACTATPDQEYHEVGSTVLPGGPVLTLYTPSGAEIPGLQGSYCDTTMCVDTIPLMDLFKESGLDFWPMNTADSQNLILKTDKSFSSYSVGLRSEEGEILRCHIESEEKSKMEVSINLCGTEGEVFVDVFVQYKEGGDASFYYPISIEPEPMND